jgi:hypothetical protein
VRQRSGNIAKTSTPASHQCEEAAQGTEAAQGFRYIVDNNFSLKIHSDNFHVELLCFTRLLNSSLGFLIDSASKEAEGIDVLRLGQ